MTVALARDDSMSTWIPSPIQLEALWLGFRLGQLATLVRSQKCDFSHRNCFKSVCDRLTFRVTRLCFDPSSNESIRALFRSLQTEWADLPRTSWNHFESIKENVRRRLEPLFESTLEVLGAFGPEEEASFLLGWHLGLSERKWPEDGVHGQDDDPRRYLNQVLASNGAILPWTFEDDDVLRACLTELGIDKHYFDDDGYEKSSYGPLWSHWSVIEDRIRRLEGLAPYLGVNISPEGVVTRRGFTGETKLRESESRLLQIYLAAGKNWTRKEDLVKKWETISRRKARSPSGAIDQANTRLRGN